MVAQAYIFMFVLDYPMSQHNSDLVYLSSYECRLVLRVAYLRAFILVVGTFRSKVFYAAGSHTHVKGGDTL
jgi:hypothetical protein